MLFCITLPAKEEMHGLDFMFCPIRLITLRWILVMKPQAGGQVLKNQHELFLHTPGSWCSCVHFQDFPHCSVVMIINVAALARSCIGKQDLRGKKGCLLRVFELLTQAKSFAFCMGLFPISKGFA